MDNLKVKEGHYLSDSYDSKGRFASYWHQINEILILQPTSVLEVGVGNGFLSEYLRKRGVTLTTVDFDERLKPDVVGSVLNLPFEDQEFDVVVCYQVLEHIPYNDLTIALGELRRASKRKVIISLPDVTPKATLHLRLPMICNRGIVLSLPLEIHQHVFDGQHYWEIGKKNSPLRIIAETIRKAGFTIERTYRVYEFPYHRFFVLR